MTGSLQVKNDKYYAVLNFRDNDGKRVQKWIPLNLPLRGNKRKAETMLRQLIEQYQGLEAIEPINRLLGQHIADWVEHNRPKLAVTTYNQYMNILNHSSGEHHQDGIQPPGSSSLPLYPPVFSESAQSAAASDADMWCLL